MGLKRMKANDSVQAVERAVDLLYCFSLKKPELTINDFVTQTNLKRTTVYRLLASLMNKGLVVKNEIAGTYKLGTPFLIFYQIVNETLDIRMEALPIMKELGDLTNETVSLNIIQGLSRVCIEKIDGTEDIREFIKLGFPYPIFKGASGKLLLAYSSDDFVEQVLQSFSNEGIDKEAFIKELHKIKEQGYAFSMNERIVGAFAISTPIFGLKNELLGGLSISGLSMRLTDTSIQKMIDNAIIAAKTISRKMGNQDL